jgi:hypothetical protein
MATVVIVLLVLLVLGGTGLLALRAVGVQPPWVAQTRHALGEAAYRARGVIAEFGDWLRLGR